MLYRCLTRVLVLVCLLLGCSPSSGTTGGADTVADANVHDADPIVRDTGVADQEVSEDTQDTAVPDTGPPDTGVADTAVADTGSLDTAADHKSRVHQGLDMDCPEHRPVEPPESGRVVEIPQVGGLHHRYERRAV